MSDQHEEDPSEDGQLQKKDIAELYNEIEKHRLWELSPEAAAFDRLVEHLSKMAKVSDKRIKRAASRTTKRKRSRVIGPVVSQTTKRDFDTGTIQRGIKTTINDGGFTFTADLKAEYIPVLRNSDLRNIEDIINPPETVGYIVTLRSVNVRADRIVPGDVIAFRNRFLKYIRRDLDLLIGLYKMSGAFDGYISIDLNLIVSHIDLALSVGVACDQQSIWDPINKENIRMGGRGDPEPLKRARLEELLRAIQKDGR
jgi:hypothetical protein